MINLDIFRLQSFYSLSNFESHDALKEKLLHQISLADNVPMNWKDKYYDDNIHRCDWDLGEDFKRTFVKEFLPPLNDHLDEIGKAFSLSEVVLRQIWYQQYKTGDLHGWHNHAGCQFTGVYYLDQPKDAPKTQIITPLSDEVITIDFKEGDILIIPSYIIHTSQKNTSDKIKTIISFNFDWKNIFSDSLLKFNQHLN